LWVMDIAARLAAIILAVIHAGTEVALLSHPLIPSRPFTVQDCSRWRHHHLPLPARSAEGVSMAAGRLLIARK
jgi:hypothetical protein